ncbi:uncharacterized protein LOC132260110 [Phlebotomus argentipes]|uniref:uncharacterized protein LOC132260110 n=1 Tax=Phlebotomus argentipes TaxID=94469 RepID=UPI002892CF91|nr:uncharacterized protein LOC132260110 [Phlebotomus argentipes]
MEQHPSLAIREKVIAAVKRHPGIYDTRLKEFKFQSLRDKAWAQAAKEVDLPVKQLKLIFQTLRQTYSRKVRKMREAPADEATPWPFYKQMSFLYEFVKPRKINNCPKRAQRHIHTESTEYECNVSGQAEEKSDMEYDPLDEESSFLKDAIIMDSDASEDVYKDKHIVTSQASSYIQVKRPSTELQHHQDDTTTANSPYSSTNPDIFTYYSKIIGEKLRSLPPERAENIAIKFIVELNAELKK